MDFLDNLALFFEYNTITINNPMKNLKTFFTAILLLCCTAIQAQYFSVRDMRFEVLSKTDKTVELSSISNSIKVLNIPSQVTYEGETYSVVSISRVTLHIFMIILQPSLFQPV